MLLVLVQIRVHSGSLPRDRRGEVDSGEQIGLPSAGVTVARYDYGPDRLLSLDHTTEGRQFYLFDAQRSVTDLVALDGTARAAYHFDAWGALRGKTGGSFNAFGFTGHEQDGETGLYYLKARFYDPELGRFLSQDPADGSPDNPPSLHRYLYAYGNPTVYIDPDGRFGLRDVWDAATIGVETAVDIAAVNLKTAGAVAGGLLKTAVNVVDFGSLGSISAASKQVETFVATKGTLSDKMVAAQNVDTLAVRAHVLSLGFSDAPDKLQHLEELTGVDRIEHSVGRFRTAYRTGDVEEAALGVADLAGGVGTLAGVASLGVEGLAEAGIVPRAGVTRAAALANGAEAITQTAEATAGKRPLFTEEAAEGGVGAAEAAPPEGVPAGACFVAGTPVVTERGSVAIERIQKGDNVLARDETTGKTTWKPVVRRFVTPNQPVLRLTLVAGSGTRETLGVTAKHPFHVAHRGWVGAGELKPGDRVDSADGKVLAVESLTATRGRSFITWRLRTITRISWGRGRRGCITHALSGPLSIKILTLWMQMHRLGCGEFQALSMINSRCLNDMRANSSAKLRD